MGGFNFAPRFHALCSGQTLPINQNQALFSLLGTTFGGNGQTTFQLPDLRSRVPVGMDTGWVSPVLGEYAGVEDVTLAPNNLPSHNHSLLATTADGQGRSPQEGVLAASRTTANTYAVPGPLVPLANHISNTGLGIPHSNIQPYQALNYFIALQGIFPSRS